MQYKVTQHYRVCEKKLSIILTWILRPYIGRSKEVIQPYFLNAFMINMASNYIFIKNLIFDP